MEGTREPLKRFGPHVLLHVAGAGGMGRVQLALSGRPGMTKVCVLKRIHADLRTPDQEARFRREANVALRLSHGAIAQTFAVDQIDGELCLLQEFVQGVSVLHLLSMLRFAGAIMPIAVAVHIAREVARALAYAHTLRSGGIVHRDVTPDNVMLSYSGEVKLIDFGLAKPFSDPSLTTVGMVVGRRPYTAPEAFSREPVDARADIYSLGVVLWQMLTGQSLEENGVVSPWPAPSSFNGEVPIELDALVTRMLAPAPRDRPQTAVDVQVALGDLLPSSFHGDRDLAALIGHLYSVDRDREMLAAEIASAERALAEEPSSGHPSPAPARKQEFHWPAIAVIAAILMAATGALSWRTHRKEPRRSSGTATAAVVQVPPAPPTIVSPPPSPEPPAQSPPDLPEQSAKARPRQLPPRRAVAPVAREPSEASPNADELLHRAEMSFDLGDLASALELARTAARTKPSARAHMMAGRVFLSDGKLAEAERELTEAVRLSAPDDRTATELLERVRARRQRGGP